MVTTVGLSKPLINKDMSDVTKKAVFIASVIVVVVGITVSGNYVYNRFIKK